jgi:amino acid permease
VLILFTIIISGDKVFFWCLNLCAVGGFVVWSIIGLIQLRFRQAYIQQGRDVGDLPFRTLSYPYSGLFCFIFSILVIFGQGYDAFYPHWDGFKFMVRYIGLLPYILCFSIHKLVTKSKMPCVKEIGNLGNCFLYQVS